MDMPEKIENPEPEKSKEEEFATRRIDPSELNPTAEQKPPTGEDAKTVLVTNAEDPEATKVISAIQEKTPPAPMVVEPPKPISSPIPPASYSSSSMPKNDNRASIVAIIAVAVIALVCICACTAIVITTLMMIPNF